MNRRTKIQSAHQYAVIQKYVRWHNDLNKSNYCIVETPDPPDALISDGKSTSWIEHTDLFRNQDEARSLMTFISQGESHIPHSANLIVEPDKQMAQGLIDRLGDKFSKRSYEPFFDKFGKGTLLVSVQDPLFGYDTLQEIETALRDYTFNGDLGYFKDVFLVVKITEKVEYISLR